MAKVAKLPSAVIQQRERTDNLIKEFITDKPTEEPVVEPVDVESTVGKPSSEVKPDAPEPVVSKDAQYWEHRFKTLEGMFNAYKTKEYERVKAAEDAAKQLKQKLDETVASVPREYDLRKYMSEQEIESYGEGMLKTILRTAAKMADDSVTERVSTVIKEQVDPIKDRMASNEQQLQNDRLALFWDHINTSVPNWQEINVDKGFHAWLSEIEGLTGLTRQDVLASAQGSLDAPKVITIFNTFLKTRTSEKDTTRQNLERRIVPETVGPSENHRLENEVESISKSFIKRFYDDKKLGRYNRRPEEAKQLEKKINAAYLAGRVVEG